MNSVIKSAWARVVKAISSLLADRKTAANPADCGEKVEACEREIGLCSVSPQVKRDVSVCAGKSFWGKIKSCDEWFKGRRVVIDGTNVCYWGGKSGLEMSLALLLALCADLHRRGVDYMVYFDASTRYCLQKMGAAGDAALYCRLLDARPDRFHEVKARTTADEAVLMDVAAGVENEKPTVFVTRDHYRDHVGLFPFASDENLRLEGAVRENGIRFGKIGWFVPYKKVA